MWGSFVPLSVGPTQNESRNKADNLCLIHSSLSLSISVCLSLSLSLSLCLSETKCMTDYKATTLAY